MRTLQALMVLLLLTALRVSPLLADDVYLKNGRTFEGVVAEVGDAQVRIQMPGGSITLARGAVDRVEKSQTSFSEYLQRKQALENRQAHGGSSDAAGPGDSAPPGGPGTSSTPSKREVRATDWLELARWARRNGFPQGAREAALTAAEMDPRLPGLASLLRPSGYVYEEKLDRWVSYDDSMRLHGFVQDHGQWITRDEAKSRDEQGLAAQQAATATAQAREMALMRAQVELAQQTSQLAQNPYGGYDQGVVLGGFYGGLGWPGFASPVFGFGADSGVGVFGIGGSRARGFAHRGFEHHGGREHHAGRELHGSFNHPRHG